MYIQPKTTLSFIVDQPEHAHRIDTVLPMLIPGYSRTFFQNLIASNHVTLNQAPVKKSKQELKIGDALDIYFPENPAESKKGAPTDHLGVQIIYEHEQFLIINKPAGLVVHAPSTQSTELSLVDWLIAHYADIASVGPSERAGIVHRLDKNTSGIMIIPRTNYALAQFGTMFKDRKIQKTYHAVVEGVTPAAGHIDYHIDRHRTESTKMTHLYGSGRPALTHYVTLKQSEQHSLLELKPVTGRTHQIRVHCAAIRHPLVGDAVYGSASPLIGRHALHAHALAFAFEGIDYSFSAPAPEDFNQLIVQLTDNSFSKK